MIDNNFNFSFEETKCICSFCAKPSPARCRMGYNNKTVVELCQNCFQTLQMIMEHYIDFHRHRDPLPHIVKQFDEWNQQQL